MRQLIYSPKATRDIDEIYDYTEAKWGFQQAEDYVFDIRDCRRLFSAGTKVGRPADPVRHGYLLIRRGAHYIVYKADAQTITIIRILHQRMNITAHLR
ncbi:MAG: type II toxin-antitoxin system RelE/ParE family toxin [Rhizobium sp.]